MINDTGGRPMGAMKVFSESIRYLKVHALDMLSEHMSEGTFSASDVTWVLTVPAIWNPAAKQFMREAAIQVSLLKLFSKNVMVLLPFEIPFEYQFSHLLTITDIKKCCPYMVHQHTLLTISTQLDRQQHFHF